MKNATHVLIDQPVFTVMTMCDRTTYNRAVNVHFPANVIDALVRLLDNITYQKTVVYEGKGPNQKAIGLVTSARLDNDRILVNMKVTDPSLVTKARLSLYMSATVDLDPRSNDTITDVNVTSLIPTSVHAEA